MLVRAFASTLSAASEPHSTMSKAHAFPPRARRTGRAGERRARCGGHRREFPAIWGGATLELPEIIEDEPAREPDNVIRIDRQSPPREGLSSSTGRGSSGFGRSSAGHRSADDGLVPREVCEAHRFVPLGGWGGPAWPWPTLRSGRRTAPFWPRGWRSSRASPTSGSFASFWRGTTPAKSEPMATSWARSMQKR